MLRVEPGSPEERRDDIAEACRCLKQAAIHVEREGLVATARFFRTEADCLEILSRRSSSGTGKL